LFTAKSFSNLQNNHFSYFLIVFKIHVTLARSYVQQIGVIIVQKAASPLTATALKSSAGLAEHMAIYQAPSTKAAVLLLKEAGYSIYMAMVDKNSQPAHLVEYAMPLCMVIGNEGTGIGPDIARQGKTVHLPQVSPDVSYNASVAAGILLFMVATKTNLLKA
jgi:23S rRNA (guanosine2251-2'-O)-methyltransferase